jgi:hypothetical protein
MFLEASRAVFGDKWLISAGFCQSAAFTLADFRVTAVQAAVAE